MIKLRNSRIQVILLGEQGLLGKWEGGKYRRTKVMGKLKRISGKPPGFTLLTIYQTNNNKTIIRITPCINIHR